MVHGYDGILEIGGGRVVWLSRKFPRRGIANWKYGL